MKPIAGDAKNKSFLNKALNGVRAVICPNVWLPLIISFTVSHLSFCYLVLLFLSSFNKDCSPYSASDPEHLLNYLQQMKVEIYTCSYSLSSYQSESHKNLVPILFL